MNDTTDPTKINFSFPESGFYQVSLNSQSATMVTKDIYDAEYNRRKRFEKENEELKKQVEIAKETLRYYDAYSDDGSGKARQALKEIEKLERENKNEHQKIY